MSNENFIKRRSIKDVDADISKVKANIENITDRVADLHLMIIENSNKIDAKISEIIQDDTGGEEACASIDSDVNIITGDCLPAVPMDKNIIDWVEWCAEEHSRTIEQELQLIIKTTYFESKSSWEAAKSRTATLSGMNK